jgi:regulator of protease activity HflC (stomatin/prohibitin superfamily)
MRKGAIGGVFLAVLMIVGLILIAMCANRVPTGHVGVVYNMNGGVDGEILTQGWHIVSPTKKVTTYSIGIEQSYLTEADKGDSKTDESFSTPTSDGKSLVVDLEFSYKFDETRVAETFTRFKGQSGEDVKNSFIKPKMIAWTQEVTAKYPVTDVFGDKRQELNEALDVYLKAKFEPYGIIIDTVNFTNISTDEETQAAIQKKVTAQQELELAQIEAETAKIQAEKDKEVALIEAEKNKETALIQAEQAKIKAEGEAEAKKIAAEAEAEANRKIAESLTPELIEKIKYEQWNGELPQVQGNATPIVNIAE